VTGDDELDPGEVRAQPVAYTTLPRHVEVGVHLVNDHHAGHLHHRVPVVVQARVQSAVRVLHLPHDV
jgi:hypothetical protein